jgi:hypothetical protein
MRSYPWFNAHSTLYHTHVCHSELNDERPGHSDPRQARSGVPFSADLSVCFVHSCSYGLYGWIGSLGFLIEAHH